MYPRNSATPERIAIGPVVQISDGAVQTSGCTVRVLESGGTEGDGGGTTAYSTDGVVLYTPTQAETDQSSFVLIAKKSGCIPASISIITSASATAGTVLLAPVTHTSAVIPTVTTTTTATNVTTVNGLAAGVITAASIAPDAIGASELAADAVTEIANAIAAIVIDTGMTLQDAIKLVLAASAGKVSGAAGTTVTIRDTTDTYDRIVATVDSSGNRSAVTYVKT